MPNRVQNCGPMLCSPAIKRACGNPVFLAYAFDPSLSTSLLQDLQLLLFGESRQHLSMFSEYNLNV